MDNKLTDIEVQELIKQYPIGVLDSPIDERDYLYEPTCATQQELPSSFSLDYNYPILNQGQIGSCVAHSIAEMKSYINAVDNTNIYSVGFIYANRKEDDFSGNGLIPRQALSNIVLDGDCLNSDFPINEEYPSILSTLDRYNKEQLFEKASKHRSKAFAKLEVEQIKEYLVNQQKPILITVKVYSSFYQSRYEKGIVRDETYGTYFGSHAMVIIGYDSDTLKILNSWGDFGDNGYIYLNINNPIIKELWVLEDEKIIKPVKKTYWRVQVSANKLKESAIEDCNKLATYGIDTCPVLVNGWWKVQCGCFTNEENRDNITKKLEDLGYVVYIEKVEK